VSDGVWRRHSEDVHASATCSASPGDSDYCDECGPCGEGEGDCDSGECQAGFECVEEGAVDRCRPMGPGSSNLQVLFNGEWRGVCCNGGRLEVSDGDCWWTESDRTLTDQAEDRELDCPEGGPHDCDCDGSGERMHGINGWGVNASLSLPEGGPIYPNYHEETCVYVKPDGELATDWTHPGCPNFRLR
jgi:hypothetical protein